MKKVVRKNSTLLMSLLLIMTVLFAVPASAEVTEIVHKDYILEGGFDTSPTKWTKSSPTIESFLSWDATGDKNGQGAIKMDFTSADSSVTGTSQYRNAAWVQKLYAANKNALSLSKTYRVTFDAKSAIAFTPKVSIVPKVDGQTKNAIVFQSNFAESAANTWTTYSFLFSTYFEGGTRLNQLEIKFNYGSAFNQAAVWYDNVSVVEDYNECTFLDKDGNIANTIPDDGKMKAKYHLVNNTATDTTAALYLAVYEVQGNTKLLKNIGVTDTKTIEKYTTEDFETSVTISGYNAEDGKDYIIKAFLWSNVGSLVPLEEAVCFQEKA